MMDRRLGRLLNTSLISMVMLSDPGQAQIGPTTEESASLVWLSHQAEWLSMLRPKQRHLLLESNEALAFWPRSAGDGGDENRNARFISAIQGAWKKGLVERSVEGYTEVLIRCQKAQSPALTVPFMRSDSQQAHCFRF